jgi:hypothetical protein
VFSTEETTDMVVSLLKRVCKGGKGEQFVVNPADPTAVYRYKGKCVLDNPVLDLTVEDDEDEDDEDGDDNYAYSCQTVQVEINQCYHTEITFKVAKTMCNGHIVEWYPTESVHVYGTWEFTDNAEKIMKHLLAHE